jgi:hypothetical protein
MITKNIQNPHNILGNIVFFIIFVVATEPPIISRNPQSGFPDLFKINRRDGDEETYSIKFGDNPHTVQLFLMESEGLIPTQKKRTV